MRNAELIRAIRDQSDTEVLEVTKHRLRFPISDLGFSSGGGGPYRYLQ